MILIPYQPTSDLAFNVTDKEPICHYIYGSNLDPSSCNNAIEHVPDTEYCILDLHFEDLELTARYSRCQLALNARQLAHVTFSSLL